MILEKSENFAKFSIGPMAEIPGPILFIVVSTPLKDVAKSKLFNDINNTDKINIAI